jgi:hypothetical protein
MARQLATSAALPVLNTLGDSAGAAGLSGLAAASGALPDPHPRRHVMRMYTCPDHYVVFPPATGAGPGAAAVVVERGSMRAWPAAPGEAERLASGRAKIEILGVRPRHVRATHAARSRRAMRRLLAGAREAFCAARAAAACGGGGACRGYA